jgi:hypothetical protein
MVSGKRNLQLLSAKQNYVNISEVKWKLKKLKNATYLIFLYITDGVLLVRYRRNEWGQFFGVPNGKEVCARNPASNVFTLKLPLQPNLNT